MSETSKNSKNHLMCKPFCTAVASQLFLAIFYGEKNKDATLSLRTINPTEARVGMVRFTHWVKPVG